MTKLYKTITGTGATIYFVESNKLIGVIEDFNGNIHVFKAPKDELNKVYMQAKKMLEEKIEYRKVIKLAFRINK